MVVPWILAANGLHPRVTRKLREWRHICHDVLGRLPPRVAMVKATQAWQGNQTGMSRWFSLDRTSMGRVFAQGVVNAILLVIAHVLADQTAKVFFLHRDDMVEDLAAAASNPSFSGSVVPW